jgi:organic hydroperoxide reductase OsmC/OhrA
VGLVPRKAGIVTDQQVGEQFDKDESVQVQESADAVTLREPEEPARAATFNTPEELFDALLAQIPWATQRAVEDRLQVHFGESAVNNPETMLNKGIMTRIDVNFRTELDKRDHKITEALAKLSEQVAALAPRPEEKP